jgi:AhpD family alkylhydroperoxidase
MLGLEKYVRSSGLEARLLHLIKMRASQINGCAFCMDMHSHEALADGEKPQRLYTLNGWRETPFFTPKERAALAFTEELTLIAQHHGISPEVREELESYFTAAEIVRLTMAIVAINGWNRIVLATGTQPAERA